MAFTSFLQYLEFEKRVSRNTLTSYVRDLDQGRAYMQWQFDLADPGACTRDMMRSWVVALAEEGNTPTTIHRKISAWRSFFRFQLREGARSDNPCARLSLPKKPKRLPVFIDESAMQLLMSVSESEVEKAGYTGLLELTVVELLYATGIRLSELIGLKDSDVTDKYIKVLGKRNKQRLIPLTNRVLRYIKAFRQKRNEMGFNGKDMHFLLLKSGKKLYPKFVYRLVTGYLSRVSTQQKKSPHVLRHTFATHLLNKGAQLGAIRELLGHASLAATQVYTHNSIKQLKNIYQQAHPMGL